jgi:DNA mismatch endonuclease, patch repair protein
MDVLTKKQRSYCMSRIRKTNTTPELMVRQMLHGLGYRFRLYRKDLPGCPDIVLPSYRKIIFVHGCWWHRHNCALGKRTPKSRPEYWLPKLASNKSRDIKNRKKLRNLGWDVLVILECQLKNSEKIAVRLKTFLSSPKANKKN